LGGRSLRGSSATCLMRGNNDAYNYLTVLWLVIFVVALVSPHMPARTC